MVSQRLNRDAYLVLIVLVKKGIGRLAWEIRS
jgi:hypothetical protein